MRCGGLLAEKNRRCDAPRKRNGAPGDLVGKYAIDDVKMTHRLFKHLGASIEERGMLDAYQRDLEEVLPEIRGRIVERVLRKVDGGLPFPHVGRGKLQPALTQPLGRIHLAGDYLGSWYAETAARTGQWAAENVKEQLDA